MYNLNEFLTITHQFTKFYTQRISRAAEEFHISKVEADVLLFLYNNPSCNTAKEIVEFRHITKSYVSKAVELLVKGGYLACSEDKNDRRITRLGLLPKAEPVVKRLRQEQEKAFQMILKGITDSEQEKLRETIGKIYENIKGECL